METRIKIGEHRITIRHPEGAKPRIEGTTLVFDEEPEEIHFNTELQKAGVKWGDAIAWATKKVGIEQCAKCKERQIILNQVKQLGWRETIKQIKETL